jgi:hypothetical protein
MCAPGDQRKSSDDQRQQAELNALQCPSRADVSREGARSASREHWVSDLVGFGSGVVDVDIFGHGFPLHFPSTPTSGTPQSWMA